MIKRLIAAVSTATVVLLAACTGQTDPPDPENASTPATSQKPSSAPSTSASSQTSSSPVVTPSTDPSITAGTTSPSTSSETTSPAPDTSAPTTTEPTDGVRSVTIPSSITGADRDAAKQATVVWRNAMRLYDQSMQHPNGRDWEKALRQYVRDPALAFQLHLVNTFTKHGLHQVGATRYDATIVTATTHEVQISACVDVSHSDVVDESGDSAAGDGRVKFRWEFNIDLYRDSPEGWFLNYVTKPDPSEPC